MFGGLALCSLEAVVGKDGKEVMPAPPHHAPPAPSSPSSPLLLLQVIIEVNDCALGLMGEGQEEDRRHIAELVLAQMEADCGLMPQELMVSTEDGGCDV
jgi:hypothetical protein